MSKIVFFLQLKLLQFRQKIETKVLCRGISSTLPSSFSSCHKLISAPPHDLGGRPNLFRVSEWDECCALIGSEPVGPSSEAGVLWELLMDWCSGVSSSRLSPAAGVSLSLDPRCFRSKLCRIITTVKITSTHLLKPGSKTGSSCINILPGSVVGVEAGWIPDTDRGLSEPSQCPPLSAPTANQDAPLWIPSRAEISKNLRRWPGRMPGPVS